MAALRAGDRYGRYQILQDELAEGLCGPVYLADITRDDGGNELVALKFLTNKQSQVRQYFLNEERLLKRADHPHVARFVHSNVSEEPYTLATAFIEAFDHKEDLAPLKNPAIVVPIVEHIGGALDYLHTEHPNAPVIHRDVKPDNILVGRQTKEAVLIDLSVATHASFGVVDERGFGTPPYMPPEQFTGHEVPASDQFALALVAYYFLAGKPMVEARPPKSKQVSGMDSADPAIYAAALDQWYQLARPSFAKQHDQLRAQLADKYPNATRVLLKASAFQPEERYGSCLEFAAALRAALSADGSTLSATVALPNHRRRTMLSVAAIAALMVAAFAALAFLWSGDASGAAAITATPSVSRAAATAAVPTPQLAAALPSGGAIATVTLPPFPTITLPPTTSKIGPTSTLPAFVAVTGTPTAGRIVRITVRRTILRAAPGDGALNVLRNQVLPVGDQLEITDAAGSKIKGDRRVWYKVRRLSDQVEGWIADGSFE